MNWGHVPALAAALSLTACSEAEEANRQVKASATSSECYKEAGTDFAQPRSDRALFVVLDQTTGLDDKLRKTVQNNVGNLLEPGTEYAIYTFSAYSRDRYVTPVLTGELAAPVAQDERGDLSVRRLAKLDKCLEASAGQSISEVEEALQEATRESSSQFTNSEIMASLKQVSEAVRESKAGDKMVLIVSDLLEHSSGTSFYTNKRHRAINPEAELKKATDNKLLADFDGAGVAVVGAGLLSPDSGSTSVRDTKALQSLRDFWEVWLSQSNAKLVRYGEPDLPTAVRW